MLRLLRLVFIGGLAAGCSQQHTPPAELLQQARAALSDGNFDRAVDLAGLIPRSSTDWAAAQTLAGEAATKAGRLPEALRIYEALARRGTNSDDATAGWFYAAEINRELGQLARAEQAYRTVLALSPENAATHERLAFLFGVTGRRWEALPHYEFLLKSGTAQVTELIVLADLDRPLEHRGYLDGCAAKAPDDLLVQFGLAVHAFWEGASVEAEERLRAAVAQAPGMLSGQAMLGELLIDGVPDDFLRWHDGLPREASGHPDIWYVRGLWARRHDELHVAARCFWEALQRAPTHRRATYHLGQVLAGLSHDASPEFERRAQQLIRLTQLLDDILRSETRREAPFRETTLLLEQMGRVWEACGWAVAAERQFPDARWTSAVFQRLSRMLNDDLPLTTDAANLALRHDLSGYPGPEELFRRTQRSVPAAPTAAAEVAIRFNEQAAAAGLDFSYYNGPDASTAGVRMFESNGGGLAALDYDADGWPDLYFTQGAEWQPGADVPAPSARYFDRLYRNTRGTFSEVTEEASLGDQGFGQGCAAGDLDNDGFPDLYVANIGRNRLYRNNGDGTFADITESCGLVGDDWTASCVIVDLNADGFPDLFDVNYLQGDGLHRAICGRHACSPTVFGGAPSRLFISRGDGSFEFVPDATPVKDPKGLGVVAAALDDPRRPSLFIANDQVANFLLRSVPGDGPHSIRIEEEAFPAGLAFNEDGLATACMGIAADDADGNGLLDFFVTNFENEANTLYLQDAPGLFVDATNAAGLRAPSWAFVGWGTQFLDVDRDGAPDLVVTNGHVDDYREDGGEYHMRPQFFRNDGGGRFVELFADDSGPFFGQKHLGRGLARLDWNRDGRMDFAVSNIGEPASLVTNESTGVGRFLNVRLHARATARDAIGAVVEVAAGERRWTKQLVAGDGYMASNERVLQFGLGPAESITELTVKWPSGSTTMVRDLPVNLTIDLVEGGSGDKRWDGSGDVPFVVR